LTVHRYIEPSPTNAYEDAEQERDQNMYVIDTTDPRWIAAVTASAKAVYHLQRKRGYVDVAISHLSWAELPDETRATWIAEEEEALIPAMPALAEYFESQYPGPDVVREFDFWRALGIDRRDGAGPIRVGDWVERVALAEDSEAQYQVSRVTYFDGDLYAKYFWRIDDIDQLEESQWTNVEKLRQVRAPEKRANPGTKQAADEEHTP
jgi:hypothetical protein